MIAQQRRDLASGCSGLRLQAHNEIDDLNAIGSAIDEIAQKPERRRATNPGMLMIDQVCVLEQVEQPFELAMNITNDVDGGR